MLSVKRNRGAENDMNDEPSDQAATRYADDLLLRGLWRTAGRKCHRLAVLFFGGHAPRRLKPVPIAYSSGD